MLPGIHSNRHDQQHGVPGMKGRTDVLDDAVVVGQLGVALPESLAVGAHLLLSLALDLASNLCQALAPILQSRAACQDTSNNLFTNYIILARSGAPITDNASIVCSPAVQ